MEDKTAAVTNEADVLLSFIKSLKEKYESGDLDFLPLNADDIDLLRLAGINKINELANINPDLLYNLLQTTIIENPGLFRTTPSLATITLWVHEASSSSPENIGMSLITAFNNQKTRRRRELAEKQITLTLQTRYNLDTHLSIEYLEDEVIPWLRAVTEIQRVLEDCLGGALRIRIHSISRNSPITISIEGVAETAKVLQQLFSPWRREHAQVIAKLEEDEKLLQVEKLKSELIESNAKTRKVTAEANKEAEEVVKLKLENERMKLMLEKEKFDLALAILGASGVDISNDATIAYAKRLFKPLETLLGSDLEITKN